MRQLRYILKIKWQDFITNQQIRDRTQCDTIENILARNQLRWLGHVCRMSEERLPKQMLYGDLVSGQRHHGGQVKSFKDVIHCILKKADIQNTWETLCRDRGTWRRISHCNKGIFPTMDSATRTRNTETYICPECQRSIKSRIGLWSHQRAHDRRRQRVN